MALLVLGGRWHLSTALGAEFHMSVCQRYGVRPQASGQDDRGCLSSGVAPPSVPLLWRLGGFPAEAEWKERTRSGEEKGEDGGGTQE